MNTRLALLLLFFSTGLSLPTGPRCFCACPEGESCFKERIRSAPARVSPEALVAELFGASVEGLTAEVSLDLNESFAESIATIFFNGEAATQVSVSFSKGSTNQVVVYQGGADSYTPAGAAVLVVERAEDIYATGGDSCEEGRPDPTSELRAFVDPQMTAGSLALNADALAAVLEALRGSFAEHGLTEITTAGCSVGGKLALRSAWNSDVITSVIAVRAGSLCNSQLRRRRGLNRSCIWDLRGDCAIAGPSNPMVQLASDSIFTLPGCHSGISQNKTVPWEKRSGATENFIAGLLDKGKTVYMVSSRRDNWSNPLGAWATFRLAPIYAQSPGAAERLKLKTLQTSNHCGFPQPFDLDSEFSSEAACHMSALQCDLIENWLEGSI